MRERKVLLTMVVCLLVAGTSVFGAGFQLYTEGSAEALGQAAAISGRTNLTSLAWYNPSGLAGTDSAQIMLGSTFVMINTDFDSDNGSVFDTEMEDHWRSVPHLYYVQPVSDQFTGMLSINAPYGLITEWPGGWIGNIAAIYTELTTIYTTPSLAFRINDQFAISAGFNIVYAEAELTAYRNLTGLGGPNLGDRKLTGDDLGWGYTASAHWNVLEDWALGARFQSRVDLELEGDIEYQLNPGFGDKFDLDGDITLPSTVNFGIANNSIDKLHLGLDCVWSEWSTYDKLVFNFPTNPYEGPANVVPKKWKDVWSIRAGAEYELTENLALRAGYVWDQSPVNDSTRSPELPGSDRQMVMAGLGIDWKGIGIDLAYSYLWAKKVDTGSIINAATSGATAGSYETDTHLVSVSASYAF